MKGVINMMLYNRCIGIIREVRYVGNYYSINEYRCNNKVIYRRCSTCNSSG